METREYFEKVIGSHLGAENIAFMFSLFESCKLNEINFGDYTEDILTRLMEGEQDFMSLIPCNLLFGEYIEDNTGMSNSLIE